MSSLWKNSDSGRFGEGHEFQSLLRKDSNFAFFS
jgi:hypothetical protein